MPLKPKRHPRSKFEEGDLVIIQPKVNVEELRKVSPCFVEDMDCFIGLTGEITNVEYDHPYFIYQIGRYSYREDWLISGRNEVTIVEED